jgi:hypothetical protein
MSRKKKRTVYISGKMTGVYAYNFKAFFEKQLAFEELGFEVVNPAEYDAEVLRQTGTGRTWDECIEADKRMIREEADIIFMMKGWRTSKGARAELEEAKLKGIEIWYE